MTGPTFQQMSPAADGWTAWTYPAAGYLMGCCDCGLVHELQFRVSRQTGAPNAAGQFEVEHLADPALRPSFRVKRISDEATMSTTLATIIDELLAIREPGADTAPKAARDAAKLLRMATRH